ncbi:MAG TPA: VOC family protein [Acidimicrobiia bacterium]|jgi:PhnB protein
MSFNPYLFFGGNCREAFTRYEEIFGGELFVMTMADAPPGDHPVPPGKEHYVMHAALKFDDGTLLMASDDMMSDTVGPVQGMMVSYSTPDAGEAKRVFEALAEGGNVTQPLIETFFSPAFGMCTDRFGTPWMVNAEGQQQ